MARVAADPAAIGTGAGSVLALGAGLYGQLVGSPGNLALSPYSAAVALGMTVNGAVGATRDEMLGVLAASDTDSLDDGLNALTSYVESLAGPVPDMDDAEIALASANQLFGQAGFEWQEPFLDALARSFGAGLREVDYAGATEKARTAINGWTAEQTHDRIPEIIQEGAIDDLTRMVLVNALYFKAPWSTPFEVDATTDEEFHLGDGSTASVPMMHGSTGYGEGDGWRAAHLSYAGGTPGHDRRAARRGPRAGPRRSGRRRRAARAVRGRRPARSTCPCRAGSSWPTRRSRTPSSASA